MSGAKECKSAGICAVRFAIAVEKGTQRSPFRRLPIGLGRLFAWNLCTGANCVNKKPTKRVVGAPLRIKKPC